jgi:anti-sigma B factor antagonist
MFDIEALDGNRIRLVGRLDASQVDRARQVLDRLQGPTVADCSGLEYISSAGISVLLVTFKRLSDAGHGFRLVNVSDRIRNVFRYAGLDRILTIE